MSRSLLGFLSFCMLLAAATGGVVWYMGPPLAGILIDAERRENPYYLLQLLPAATAADGAGASYRSRFVSLAEEDEGRVLWHGGAVQVVEGSMLLDVSTVQLIGFARGADLVQMLTRPELRSLESGVDGAVQHLGTAVAPEPLAGAAATVIVLYAALEDAAAAPLGTPGGSGWLSLVPRYRGTVRWNAPATAVRGRQEWNRLLLVQFPDTAAAQSWLEDPATATERAIAGKRVHQMLVLLVEPRAYAPEPQ